MVLRDMIVEPELIEQVRLITDQPTHYRPLQMLPEGIDVL
jgi:hypothetical protein